MKGDGFFILAFMAFMVLCAVWVVGAILLFVIIIVAAIVIGNRTMNKWVEEHKKEQEDAACIKDGTYFKTLPKGKVGEDWVIGADGKLYNKPKKQKP